VSLGVWQAHDRGGRMSAQRGGGNMTHSDPLETPRADRGERESVLQGGSVPPPDPWGVKRAENLIASLTGVLPTRVVVTPLGEISEIHVLPTNHVQAKQVVRNIEAALKAQSGMAIEHRKTSAGQ